MKNFLSIILLSIFLASSANSSWFLTSSPSLFDIKLGSKISDYSQKKCLENHNFFQLKANNFLDLDKSKEARTGPVWTNWSYRDTKLPVSEGCINPGIENKDFFNFEVKIFPKTKEIYNISAFYRKVYKFSNTDFRSSECNNRAKELVQVITKSHKKKGYRFNKIGMTFFLDDARFGNDTWQITGTKGSNKNSRIKIYAHCSIEGKTHSILDNNLLGGKTASGNFLVRVAIGFDRWESQNRVRQEENILLEEMKGNKNKKLNTDGL